MTEQQRHVLSRRFLFLPSAGAQARQHLLLLPLTSCETDADGVKHGYSRVRDPGQDARSWQRCWVLVWGRDGLIISIQFGTALTCYLSPVLSNSARLRVQEWRLRSEQSERRPAGSLFSAPWAAQHKQSPTHSVLGWQHSVAFRCKRLSKGFFFSYFLRILIKLLLYLWHIF